jgi:CubicO group peptidase (beta-lactamase class C family)
VKCEAQFSLGFFRPSPRFPFARPGAFGSPGSGGSNGFADPEREIGYGYVLNRMGPNPVEDPRDIALREALSAVVP